MYFLNLDGLCVRYEVHNHISYFLSLLLCLVHLLMNVGKGSKKSVSFSLGELRRLFFLKILFCVLVAASESKDSLTLLNTSLAAGLLGGRGSKGGDALLDCFFLGRGGV